MADIKETRLSRLRTLLDECEGKQVRLGKRIGKSPSQINQWLSGIRTISEESARTIEERAKKPPHWLDQAHPAQEVPRPSQETRPEATPVSTTLPAAIELLGAALAGIPERTRRTVIAQLEGLVTNPKDAPEIAIEIDQLIQASKRRSA